MASKRKNLAKYKNNSTRKKVFLSKPKKTIKKKISKSKSRSKSYRHKHYKSKTHKRKNRKGGFGKGTKPLVGQSWDINNNANHYAHNQYVQEVGGIDPYFGNPLPAPQHTYGAWASLNQNGGVGLTDLYRNAINGITNYAPGLGRVWNGVNPNKSPSPLVQPLNNK